MEVVIIIGLILFNGLLSMSEIALISVRKSRLESEIKKGSKTAKAALELVNQPDKLFSTIQIGITLIGVFNGLYSGETFANDLAQVVQKISILSPYAYIISKITIVVAVTYLTLVFGELVPKRIGLNLAEQIAKIAAKPMLILSRIAHPFVWFLSKSTSFIVKIVGIKAGNGSKVTEEEIKAIIKEGLDVGEVQEIEHDIVERAFNLGDRVVSSIMTHRTELVSLDISDTKENICTKIQTNMHGIYPVISKRFSNTFGVVYMKDVFGKIDSPDFSLNKLIKPIHYIPENTSVYNALKQFKTASVKYGIVIDEFGDIQGIVTLTDIMEGLIGEVYAEGEKMSITKRDDDSFLVDGQYSFYNFLEYFDLEDLYAQNDYNTLSGLLLELFEHIPLTGEKTTWQNFEFEIIDMDGVRIDKVLVKRITS